MKRKKKMAEGQKSVLIGQLRKTKKGTNTISLGQSNPKKPDYDYTVQIRVLNKDGKVVAKATNPWVNLMNPHPSAPEFILNDLKIFVDEIE
jgi:hypothetical protein